MGPIARKAKATAEPVGAATRKSAGQSTGPLRPDTYAEVFQRLAATGVLEIENPDVRVYIPQNAVAPTLRMDQFINRDYSVGSLADGRIGSIFGMHVHVDGKHADGVLTGVADDKMVNVRYGV